MVETWASGVSEIRRMKRSIVLKCAVTVAVAQVMNFVILTGLAITSEIGPVYREWSRYSGDTLRGHHQVLARVVRNEGEEAARAVAEQLSIDGREHAIVAPGSDWATREHMGLQGSEWSRLAEQAEEPRRYLGRLRWITELAYQDEGGVAKAVLLSSARWPVVGAARNHPIGSAIWIVGGLGLSAIVGGFVATWFTKPILRLRTSVTRFASGEFESRPDERLQARDDEIGQLARDMADMGGRVESLVQAQRDLLDHVAHEIRSPLARISVAVELEAQRAGAALPDGAEAQDDYLAKIRRESVRLSGMVDQLLQLSAIEHRIDGISKSEISLTRIAREVAEDCGFEAEAHGRSVALDIDQEVRMIGNGELLRSAIENIVRNAIRFTPPGTAVHVEARLSTESQSRARIVIRDHGPGVPEADLQRLFEPFSRIDSQEASDGSGFGLGLALAHRSIRAHEGTMTARNFPGGGLEISIELPLLGSRNEQ